MKKVRARSKGKTAVTRDKLGFSQEIRVFSHDTNVTKPCRSRDKVVEGRWLRVKGTKDRRAEGGINAKTPRSKDARLAAAGGIT